MYKQFICDIAIIICYFSPLTSSWWDSPIDNIDGNEKRGKNGMEWK